MSNPQKRKGDRAELGVQALIHDLLGWPARRKLGAGRLDDVGDIDGVPDTVIQCADWKDAMAALREKPRQCETQQLRAGTTFGATFLRLRGGGFRVVLTPEQWATYARESQPIEQPDSEPPPIGVKSLPTKTTGGEPMPETTTKPKPNPKPEPTTVTTTTTSTPNPEPPKPPDDDTGSDDDTND